MKKLSLILAVTILMSATITAFTSCRQHVVEPVFTSASEISGYTYFPSEPATAYASQENTQTETNTTDGAQYADTTASPMPHTPSEPATEAATKAPVHEPETKKPEQTPQTTVRNSETTSAKQSAGASNVDLSIELPSANGKMEVDSSRGNKFTVIVSDERKIDAAYLVAVYSIPDSGQNYVFEFSSKTGRTADDLRRVYLIDANGKITGVAAKNASEKENVSSVENWFCMNVLIKKLIFPAVENEFN